jgi:hypothetical protein
MEHLARLRRAFGTIASRLREMIAQAVGQTVSRIVQQVLRSLLSRSPPATEASIDDFKSIRNAHSIWDEEIELRRWQGEWESDPEPVPPTSEPPSFWRRMALLVCRVATCWLQRRPWPFPMVTALGVGLIAGVAAYAGGPVAAAGTAMSLATLSDLVDSGAALAFPRWP